jgi:hypothetical protein
LDCHTLIINFGYRILFPPATDLCLGAGNASSEEGQVHLQAPDTGDGQHAAGLAISPPGLHFFPSVSGNVGFWKNCEILFYKPQPDWVRISNVKDILPMMLSFPSQGVLSAAGVGDQPRDGLIGTAPKAGTRQAPIGAGLVEKGNGDAPGSGSAGISRCDSSRSVTASQFLVESILTDLDDDLFFDF